MFLLIKDIKSLTDLVPGRISPPIVIAEEGSTFNLTCRSDTVVVWKKVGEEISRRHIIHKRHLIMYDVTVQDTGRYICMGTYMEQQEYGKRSRIFQDYADVTIGGI